MSIKRKIAVGAMLLLFAGALVVGLLAAAYLYLPVYLESKIIPQIASEAGLTDFSIEVRHVGFFSADLGNLHIGPPADPALMVRSVQVDYSPRGLYQQKIRQVTLGGIEIHAKIEDGRFKLRGAELEKLLAGANRRQRPDASPGGTEPAVSLAKLAVRNSQVVITLKDRLYRLPFELDLLPQDAQYSELDIAAHVYPRGETVNLGLKVNRLQHRAALRMDFATLDLRRFADVTSPLADMMVSGLVEMNAKAELGWDPLQISAVDASFALRHGKISGRGLQLQTAADAAGETVPFRIRLSDAQHNVWRINGGGLSMTAPAQLTLDEFDGTLRKNDAKLVAAIDFRAGLRSSQPAGDHPFPIKIRDPIPLRGRLSAEYHPTGKWQCDVTHIPPEGPAARVIRLNSAPYAITFSPPEFNLSARSAAEIIQADYRLSIPSLRISAGPAAVKVPRVTLAGSAMVTDRLASISYELQAPNTDIKLEDGHIKISKLALTGKLNREQDRPIVAEGLFQFAGAGGRVSRFAVGVDGARAKIPFIWPYRQNAAEGNLYLAKLNIKGLELGTLSSRIRQTASGFAFEGRHQSVLLPRLKSVFSGSLQLFGNAPPATRVHVDFSRSALAPEVDLGKFVPAAGGTRIKGKFQLAGDLVFDSKGMGGTLQADFDNGNLWLGQKALSLEGIRMTLNLPELPHIRSAPAQQIQFERISLGAFVAQKGRIDFQVESARSLLIEKMTFKWCDGNVETQSMRLSSENTDYQITLYCDRLNLAKVLEQFGAAAAEGKGSVNGRIPLQYTNGNIKFDDGFLFSTPGEGGKIRLTGTDILTAGIPPNTPQYIQMELAREALKDYDYSWAKLNLTSQGEELLLQMQMDGKPAGTLPFVYRNDIGGFMKVEANAKGSKFQGIRLDVNFRLPLNKLLRYKELMKMIQ